MAAPASQTIVVSSSSRRLSISPTSPSSAVDIRVLAGRAAAVYHTGAATPWFPSRASAPLLRISRGPPTGDVLMSTAVALDALDLAALLCSRVCHDLISP